MNYLKLLFLFFGVSLTFVGVFVNWFEKYVPSIILDRYRYGKLSRKKQTFQIDQVPKSWFRHFYVFSSIFSLISSLLLFSIYFNYNNGILEQIRDILSLIGGSTSIPTVSAGESLIAVILMTLHCFRRFYETHFVSVYSDSKMNFGIYCVGLLHYFGAILAIVCEAPGVLNKAHNESMNFNFTLRHLLATIVFFWAYKTQFESALILGMLRKNEKGRINSNKHYIPQGKCFELVSCPHLMCEVIIYLSLWAILWDNSTWTYVTAWVISNQVECALLTHWWYQERFQNYPKKRKAIIPYLL